MLEKCHSNNFYFREHFGSPVLDADGRVNGQNWTTELAFQAEPRVIELAEVLLAFLLEALREMIIFAGI